MKYTWFPGIDMWIMGLIVLLLNLPLDPYLVQVWFALQLSIKGPYSAFCRSQMCSSDVNVFSLLSPSVPPGQPNSAQEKRRAPASGDHRSSPSIDLLLPS